MTADKSWLLTGTLKYKSQIIMDYKDIFERAVATSRNMPLISEDQINGLLNAVADRTIERMPHLLAENKRDLNLMPADHPYYDRLKLTEGRIEDIAADMRSVATLEYPVGRLLYKTTRPNGMVITKVSVPFGVIGVIFEARPNVCFDCFALCVKSGNAVILKGGSDAKFSNAAIVALIEEVLAEREMPRDIVTLMPPQRESTGALLNAVGYVDLVIPRGSQSLINFVRDNARVPVIETGAGICHTYFDKAGDKEKGAAIINNAKTRRVSVCNALDCLVIHRDRLADLTELCARLSDSNVTIYADPDAYAQLNGKYPAALLEKATDESFGTEFLDYKMAVKTVGSMQQALEHIAKYSSRHSECIVSEDAETIAFFEKMVDAACVYANVSTAFTDGAQFGLGAEIGISTQKLHARGPMALRELTSYKYIIDGDGQIRA